jgi:hypothetical protein
MHDPRISRRCLLSQCAGALLAGAAWAQSPPPKRILVASQWHNVNIGDIAHGPGLVRLIERHLPGVEVSLWPKCQPTAAIRGMLMRVLPRLAIVEGAVSAEGRPSSPGFAAAIAKCDLMILASGGYHPTPVLLQHLAAAGAEAEVRRRVAITDVAHHLAH